MRPHFGRRVGENGSIGTDHGAGGPCFVMGSAVRGGLAGNQPSVTSLVNGNLGVTTDFRTVWQAIIGEWLGGDPTRIAHVAGPLAQADSRAPTEGPP